jgi:hypothetical protein
VSTVAVGLAAGSSQAETLLLEMDPSGGVLAARFGLAQQPGLASLAAVARHGVTGVLDDHVQRLPVGVDVVVAPGSADIAAGSVDVIARHAESVLRHLAPMVIVDVGRVYPGSPATELVAAADVVVLVATPSTEYLDHLDARLSTLSDVVQRDRIGLVLVGQGPYAAAEIAARLALPVWAELPRDPRGAGVLAGRLTGRTWQRTALVRALRDLAVTVRQRAPQPDAAALEAVAR